MYPARDTWQHVIKAHWKVAWLKTGKTLLGPATVCQFSFLGMNTTTPWNFKLKSNNFQSYPRKDTAASGEKKDAENIRKVLSKFFIQWFWEVNLYSYKYWVNCFDSLHLSVFFCCCWSTLKWKSRNTTKHLMSGPAGNQFVLFSRESWCFPRRSLRKYQDSRENKTNCFLWNLTYKSKHNVAQKNQLFSKQFTSLLLVVACSCLAGSYLADCLVCFWFVVEVQLSESSEVKYVGGAIWFSK